MNKYILSTTTELPPGGDYNQRVVVEEKVKPFTCVSVLCSSKQGRGLVGGVVEMVVFVKVMGLVLHAGGGGGGGEGGGGGGEVVRHGGGGSGQVWLVKQH